MIQKSFEADHEPLIFFKKSVLVDNGEVFATVYEFDSFSQKGTVSLSGIGEMNLDEFDLIHPALFPPLDPSIVYALGFADCVMVNNPSDILRFGEKITPLHQSSIMAWTIAGQDVRALFERMASSDYTTFVLKPTRTYGGEAIELIDLNDGNAREQLEAYQERIDGMVVVQQKLPVRETGDKRILILEDELLGWEKRVAEGEDLVANYSAGGEVIGCELTDEEREMVTQLRIHFEDFDLPLVGVDVIGNTVTEVNITNPGGMAFVKKFDDFKTGEKVISYFEDRVKTYG